MKSILLSTLFIILTLPLHAQEEGRFFKVTYKTSYNGDIDLNKIKNPRLRHDMAQMLETFKIARFDLVVGDNQSIFKLREQLENDSRELSSSTIILVDGEGRYYYNKTTPTFLIHQMKGYRIKIDVSKYDWKIHKETKRIAGYKCYRATRTEILENSMAVSLSGGKIESHPVRTYEVWFAPSLPSGFGPTNYVGLPGLVLMASGDGNFKAVSVEVVNHDKIEKPTKGELITEEEYGKKIIEAMRRIKRSH